MTAIVLQARLDSVRLPGKAMLPLDKKPVIFRVMEALNNIPADIRVLACPEDSFSTFAPLAKEASFEIFSGPKEDVLERYCQVVRKYSINRVIRATGDNPFIFTDAAAALNNEALALLADYAGYQKLPYGAGIESVAASALLFAAGKAALPFEREHVCPFLYTNENIFKLYRPDAPSKWQYPDFRLTIDDQKDYEKAVKLYSILNNFGEQRYHGTTIIKAYKSII